MKRAGLHYLLTILSLVLASLACDLPIGATTQSESHSATETMQALATQVAGTLQPPTDSGEATTSGGDSVEDEPPGEGVVPTPTITLTPTPGPPIVHVSVDTNCRFGPGSVYEYLGALLIGEEAAVTGKLADESFWYIENPDFPPPYCWIWGAYAQVEGDTSGLPILTPPPTPTATPEPIAFKTEFAGAIPCGAYAFFARIENTGTVAIESLKLDVVDTTINLTNSHVNDIFSTSVACTPGTTPRLQPGEVGYTFTSGFTQITNHEFKATVKVCTQDGLAGECVTATFAVP
jgi:hypothetical protein